MSRVIELLGCVAFVSLLLIVLGACASASSTPTLSSAAPKPSSSVNTAELRSELAQETDRQEPARADAEGAKEEDEEAKAKEEAEQARERQRKLIKLRRELEMAELKLAKAKIVKGQGELKYNDSLAKAEKDFELAKRKLQIFEKFTLPNRVARAELGVQYAEDRLWETQKELQQLELMYNEEQFADKTKEIVIERARKQLERSTRDLELRREELQTLKDVTLPLERMELELAAEQAKRALLDVQRDNEAALIDRNVAELSAEAEVVRIENELADLEEEIEEARQKKAKEAE